jgi:hypothetical protein
VVETRWWSKKYNFEEFEKFKFVSPKDLILEHTEIIQPYRWYLFNSAEFHSAHKLPNADPRQNRISFTIEFRKTSFNDVLALF